jgi:mycothiol synthase
MLSHRPATESDILAILTLADCCERVDQLHRPLRAADLTAPSRGETPADNWHLWHDATERLVAFARLQLGAVDEPGADPLNEGRFWLYVHPDVRGQGVEVAMIAWAETQTRTFAETHGGSSSYRLFTAAREDKQERRDLLVQQGFRPVRYFFTMHRSFATPLAIPAVPAGFWIRPIQMPQDLAAYVALGNAAFAAHWHHQEETEDDLLHLMRDPGYRPELDLLAIGPTGDLAGFCTCTLDELFLPRQSGLVLGLGTHPRYRGIGLGRALLLTGLHRLREQGLLGAEISVDGENPTGAVRLYESVGFVTYETWVSYFRP